MVPNLGVDWPVPTTKAPSPTDQLPFCVPCTDYGLRLTSAILARVVLNSLREDLPPMPMRNQLLPSAEPQWLVRYLLPLTTEVFGRGMGSLSFSTSPFDTALIQQRSTHLIGHQAVLYVKYKMCDEP